MKKNFLLMMLAPMLTPYIVITFVLAIMLACSSCEPIPNKNKNASPIDTIMPGIYTVYAVDYYVAGMRYKVFNTGSEASVFVINITKDSLECLKDSLEINDKHFKQNERRN